MFHRFDMRWWLLLCLLWGVVAHAAGGQRVFYVGIIGDSLAIQADVRFAGGVVSGSYVYERTAMNYLPLTGTIIDLDREKPLDSLSLTGTQGGKGAVTLKEFARGGGRTGTFSGTLSTDRGHFAGMWSSADGSRRLPFTLMAVAEYRQLVVERDGFHLTGSYPYFLEGTPAHLALSQRLYGQVKDAQQRFVREWAKEKPSDLTQEYAVTLAFYRPDLVSLLTSEYVEVAGAAHPNTDYTSSSYLLEATGPRLLGLNDLFSPDTPFLNALFDKVKADLQRQKAARGMDALGSESPHPPSPPLPILGEGGVADLKVYILSPKAITFIFPRYVAGSYAEGEYLVTLPYTALKEYINPRGPLFRFVGVPAAFIDAVTHVNAEEAARMDSLTFCERYVGITKDISTLGYVEAKNAYIDLIQSRNSVLAEALPPMQRRRVTEIRDLMTRFGVASARVERSHGWGSGYLFSSAADRSVIEDAMTEVITSLRRPTATSDADRKRTRHTMQVVRQHVHNALADTDELEDKALFKASTAELTHTLAEAENFLPGLPDHTAAVVADFLQWATHPHEEGVVGH